MKILSVLITLQGLSYFIGSIFDLLMGRMLKLGAYSINSNYNIVGIILGIWLIFTGIGFWFRKRYAYHSSIIAYSLLIIYGIITIVYLLMSPPVDTVGILVSTTVMIFFFIMTFYTMKYKSEFK